MPRGAALRSSTSGGIRDGAMEILKRGSKGLEVERWQQFVLGQGFDPKGVDGKFGKGTEAATLAFQKANALPQTGIVDNATWGVAAVLGLEIVDDWRTTREGPNWPAPPGFAPLNHQGRSALFGAFRFRHAPVPGSYENIEILDGWASTNLVTVPVPQLVGVRGAGKTGRATVHVKVRDQFLALWQAWEEADLLDRVMTWEGAFNARFIRGRATPDNARNPAVLSNHSWGTAFDINYGWNKLGAIPALAGEQGSVRELVKLANKHGFYWGGHFKGRPDGMHFEAAALR